MNNILIQVLILCNTSVGTMELCRAKYSECINSEYKVKNKKQVCMLGLRAYLKNKGITINE